MATTQTNGDSQDRKPLPEFDLERIELLFKIESSMNFSRFEQKVRSLGVAELFDLKCKSDDYYSQLIGISLERPV